MIQQMRYLSLCLRIKTKDFLTDEKGEVNIVAIVVLIGIAIILAVIFKDKIKLLLDSMFKTIGDTSDNVLNGKNADGS